MVAVEDAATTRNEVYKPYDGRREVQSRLEHLGGLETRLQAFKTREARTEELERPLDVQHYGRRCVEWEAYYNTYMYHHPEDLPKDPAHDQEIEELKRGTWIFGTHPGGSRFEIGGRQRQVFQRWTWSEASSAKDERDWPVAVGPTGEEVCQEVQLPVLRPQQNLQKGGQKRGSRRRSVRRAVSGSANQVKGVGRRLSTGSDKRKREVETL